MNIRTYLTLSRSLLNLAHQFERTYFDAKCLVPRAVKSNYDSIVSQQLSALKSRLARFAQQREQLLTVLKHNLSQDSDLLALSTGQALATQMNQLLENRQSYLAYLKDLRSRLPRLSQDSEPDTLVKQINDFLLEVQAMDDRGIKDLAIDLGGLIFTEHSAELQQTMAHYVPGTLIKNRDFLLALLGYQYPDDSEAKAKYEQAYRYLVWNYSLSLPEKVQIIAIRDVLPAAKSTGLSGYAIVLTFENTTEVFVLFKGTEFYTTEPKTSRFNPLAGWNQSFLEAYRDWRYNVQAILLGEDNSRYSQLGMAKQFVNLVQAQLPADTHYYGVGHSLGGHLVQTLQLMYECFDAGYTLNAAPVQLLQIRQMAPQLFSFKDWDHLLQATVTGGSRASEQEFLQEKLGYDRYHITNEGFAQDIIQVFYHMHFNVYVGKFNAPTRPDMAYPFAVDVSQYLTAEQQRFAAYTLGEFFKETQDSGADQSLMVQVVNFMRHWGKTHHLAPEKRQQFTDAYTHWAVVSGLLKPDVPSRNRLVVPDMVTKYFSSGKIAILRRLQPDMLELLLYFHIVDGAQYFLSDVQRPL
ncbi:MAG: hypothetical protein LKF36_06430 [Lactobacillus sp.]|nr:hypothetical protein [Lactobacillus sp.]